MKKEQYVLTLDLKDNPVLINEYIEHHKKVWPSIKNSIKESGVLGMEIYCLDRKLCMIMEVDESFTFERKAAMDAANPEVQKWETLMENYQEVNGSGAKWKLMDKIFDLNA